MLYVLFEKGSISRLYPGNELLNVKRFITVFELSEDIPQTVWLRLEKYLKIAAASCCSRTLMITFDNA